MGGVAKTLLKRRVSKSEIANQNMELPVGRFCAGGKTAAKTMLKRGVLKFKKKETSQINITVVKTQNKKRFFDVDQ